jgi:hypothetical protein
MILCIIMTVVKRQSNAVNHKASVYPNMIIALPKSPGVFRQL